jgi:hypothetical protein
MPLKFLFRPPPNNQLLGALQRAAARNGFGFLSADAPAVDVAEKDNAYEITAELPGIDQDNFEANVANEMLTIKGTSTITCPSAHMDGLSAPSNCRTRWTRRKSAATLQQRGARHHATRDRLGTEAG